MKMYFVAMLKVNNRFTERWLDWWIEALNRLGVDYEVVLPYSDVYPKTNYFTNERMSVLNELRQAKYLYDRVISGDIVFFSDLDYPGFSLPLSFFLKQRGAKVYGIIHGAYFNVGDIWYGAPRRNFDRSILDVVDKVFVASNWFKSALLDNLGWEYEDKIIVNPLPYKTAGVEVRGCTDRGMYVLVIGKDIVSLPGFAVVPLNHTWEEYVDLLSRSMFLLSTKQAETFGYTIIEAMDMGVVPVAPNRFSYPELLPPALLYDDISEVPDKIRYLTLHYCSVWNDVRKHWEALRPSLENAAFKILNRVLEDAGV